MKKILAYCLCMLLSIAIVSASPFVMAPAKRAESVSRNEVKESIGNDLHDLVTQSARIQSVVGKMMMQMAALQSTIAQQVGALVEDEPPFSTASTTKLQAAQGVMKNQIEELAQLVESFEKLATRVTKTVRLE
ncbi:MAG: hypothetical protein WCJ17_02875 [bacterium]